MLLVDTNCFASVWSSPGTFALCTVGNTAQEPLWRSETPEFITLVLCIQSCVLCTQLCGDSRLPEKAENCLGTTALCST